MAKGIVESVLHEMTTVRQDLHGGVETLFIPVRKHAFKLTLILRGAIIFKLIEEIK